MSPVAKKTVREEKGQRTARSSDVYLPKGGVKEAALCKKCGAIYRNKRWSIDGDELKSFRTEAAGNKIICPACLRMQDNNPGGIFTLRGEYLVQHEEDILNSIRHIEEMSRRKNPLGRIMEISQDGTVLIIATTEDKLAQKLGREIYKSHRGELHYQWSHDQSFVRVTWAR